MSRGTRVAAFGSAVLALVALAVVAVIVVDRMHDGGARAAVSGPVTSTQPPTAADWVFDRADDPARTLVHDKNGDLLATFTDGARTVDITGPKRTFREPKFTKASVTVNVWVRLAPQEWRSGAEHDSWFKDWFTRELTDTSLDALGMAFQYVYGASELYDAKGVRYAGDAQFGPYSSSDPDGRAENNDFYDYLGITYSFPDAPDVKPHKDRYGDVDCSGFIRLVYGYRLGYPLRNTNTPGDGLPRRAFAMSQFGPGAEVIEAQGSVTRDYAALQPGDLVFFNVDPTDGPAADHSGIFLGVDESGHYRFVSSRTLANGPTMGDSKYAAILDGDGHFALALRNARRL
jgi:cell wall-associated NlpC family hydrolase